MRQLRLGLGLLATTSAFALGAAPALAHEFVASRTGNTRGSTESEQLLKFGPFKIKCVKTVAKGAVAQGSSTTYATAVKFSKCLTSAFVGNSTKHQIFLATRWLTPLAIEYHAGGAAQTGSELEEEEDGAATLAGGSAEVKVNTGKTAEFEKSQCVISWPEQTFPLKATKNLEGEYSAATYSPESTPKKMSKTFPDGMQHGILISNNFKGIKYELEGEPCAEWGKEEGPEGGGGTYVGSFPQYLSLGNLEFK